MSYFLFCAVHDWIKDATHEHIRDLYMEVLVTTVAIMPSFKVLFIAALRLWQFLNRTCETLKPK